MTFHSPYLVPKEKRRKKEVQERTPTGQRDHGTQFYNKRELNENVKLTFSQPV